MTHAHLGAKSCQAKTDSVLQGKYRIIYSIKDRDLVIYVVKVGTVRTFTAELFARQLVQVIILLTKGGHHGRKIQRA